MKEIYGIFQQKENILLHFLYTKMLDAMHKNDGRKLSIPHLYRYNIF